MTENHPDSGYSDSELGDLKIAHKLDYDHYWAVLAGKKEQVEFKNSVRKFLGYGFLPLFLFCLNAFYFQWADSFYLWRAEALLRGDLSLTSTQKQLELFLNNVMNKNSAEYFRLNGVLLSKKGFEEAALQSFQKAYDLAPEDDALGALLTNAYTAKGDAKAIPILIKLTASDSQMSKVALWRKLVYLQIKTNADRDALSNVDKLLARHPKDPSFLYYKATLSCKAGDFNDGIKHYKSAIAYGFKDPVIFSELASALCDANQFEESLEMSNKAIESGVNDYDTYLARGRANYALKDFNGALEDYKTASGLVAGRVSPGEVLRILNEINGDIEQASQGLQKAQLQQEQEQLRIEQERRKTLIVPGQSLGQTSLGMTTAQVQQLLGAPSEWDGDIMIYRGTGVRRNFVAIRFQYDQATDILFSSSDFSTDRGITVASVPDPADFGQFKTASGYCKLFELGTGGFIILKFGDHFPIGVVTKTSAKYFNNTDWISESRLWRGN